MKEKQFYYKIKNAKIDNIELRKVELVVTASSAYDADCKLFKAGIFYSFYDAERFEMLEKSILN